MNIRQIIFNFVCSRQTRRTVSFPDWAKVRTVLVLYESDNQEKNADIQFVVKQLKDQGKQVVSVGYVQKDQATTIKSPDYCVLGLQDVNIWHKPKTGVASYWSDHVYDVMMDFSTKPLLPLQYVAVLAHAKLKMAVHNMPFYDMVVQCEENADVKYIYGQMTHYLSTIKSAD